MNPSLLFAAALLAAEATGAFDFFFPAETGRGIEEFESNTPNAGRARAGMYSMIPKRSREWVKWSSSLFEFSTSLPSSSLDDGDADDESSFRVARKLFALVAKTRDWGASIAVLGAAE